MKRLIGLMLISLLLVSCASTNPWKAEDIPGLKGMSTGEVIQKFGEPFRKSIDLYGDHVWQYRKPAEGQGGVNTFVKIASFGMSSMVGDMFIDLLTIYIRNNRVIHFTYQENVGNLSLPAASMLSAGTGAAAGTTQTASSVRTSGKRKSSSSPVSNTSVETSSELVFTSAANIRDVASNKGKILFKAKRGQKAIKVGSSGKWCNVKLVSGITGWVPKSVVFEVFE